MDRVTRCICVFEDDVVDTLMEVLGMSETAAHNWFDGTETVETSIAQLVLEIKRIYRYTAKGFSPFIYGRRGGDSMWETVLIY